MQMADGQHTFRCIPHPYRLIPKFKPIPFEPHSNPSPEFIQRFAYTRPSMIPSKSSVSHINPRDIFDIIYLFITSQPSNALGLRSDEYLKV